MGLTPRLRLGSNGAGSGAEVKSAGARRMMMTTPLPTDDLDRPAWWRNRRRWFYILVIAVPLLCLFGGGGLWYRWSFPLPESWVSQSDRPFSACPEPGITLGANPTDRAHSLEVGSRFLETFAWQRLGRSGKGVGDRIWRGW